MEITENEIHELNRILETTGFEIEVFDKFFQSLKINNNFKIKLIDFEYYNKKRLEEARKEKKICAHLQNFEKAAFNRDLELECQHYIALKTEYKIEKATFHYENNYLIYFYFSTAKNDRLVREYLIKEMQ